MAPMGRSPGSVGADDGDRARLVRQVSAGSHPCGSWVRGDHGNGGRARARRPAGDDRGWRRGVR